MIGPGRTQSLTRSAASTPPGPAVRRRAAAPAAAHVEPCGAAWLRPRLASAIFFQGAEFKLLPALALAVPRLLVRPVRATSPRAGPGRALPVSGRRRVPDCRLHRRPEPLGVIELTRPVALVPFTSPSTDLYYGTQYGSRVHRHGKAQPFLHGRAATGCSDARPALNAVG